MDGALTFFFKNKKEILLEEKDIIQKRLRRPHKETKMTKLSPKKIYHATMHANPFECQITTPNEINHEQSIKRKPKM